MKQAKLENPVRLAELNPPGTLARIGIGSTDVICDIGAGSGIFTIPAAGMTENKIYALEADEEMLKIIRRKAELEKLSNIEPILVEGDRIRIMDETADLVLMATVLHEIENKKDFLKEVNRILKSDGRIAIIEFFKHETPFGPPVPHRIAREDVDLMMESSGFSASDEFELGDNFYCLVLRKNG